MVKFFKNGWITLFVLVSLLPLKNTFTDVGPKPTMNFDFVQQPNGQPISIVAGTLLECDQPDCSDAKPLQVLGPQRFSCEANSCSAMAYGFSPYHRLEIQFSDGVTRKSNIFKTAQFQSTYQVTINPTDLVVKARISLDPINLWSPYTLILICGICLVGIIIIVVLIVLLVRRSRKR